MKGTLGTIWGVAGVVALIGIALARLVPPSLETFSHPMSATHWATLSVWVPVMAWAEGYRGFHRAFAPMVAARARYLRGRPETLHVLLAPFFCLGFLHATRRRMARSTLVSVGIAALVVLVDQLDQPWRGIVDLGVVTGLAIGLVSIVFFVWRALTSASFDYSPEVPRFEHGTNKAPGTPMASRERGGTYRVD